MNTRVRPALKVLVIDDEPDLRELLAVTLNRMQLHCVEAGTLAEARDCLARDTFELCLTDMRLPDGDGLDLVNSMQRNYPDLPVAVITAHGNMETAINALKAGAFDFLNKPVDLGDLRSLVRSALRLSHGSGVSVGRNRNNSVTELIGESPDLGRIREMTRKLSRSQAPVHISGESGTGKELVARLIHEQGHRASQPFLAVNCGAIPRELMESELFGHVKGSFSGAYSDKSGLFSAASGGTLFLDEVADLPLDMQVKLLRAIQEKAVRPVGATKEQHVDVRILSATHSDLASRVRSGDFREDLFYRINVIELAIPPLRERPEDILPLARHWLTQTARGHDTETLKLSSAAEAALLEYGYPGNVRELENILERATTLTERGVIEVPDLQLQKPFPSVPDPYELTDSETASDKTLAEVRTSGLEAWLEDREREVIQQALVQTRYNKTAAARELGITFRALRYRLKKLDMED